MKKNFMMRAASALLVAVLLSTCTISGTFAKYTTEDSASDTAQVAKWGVELQVDGDLYAENYAKDSNLARVGATDATVSTKNSGKNLVAPGTASETGLRISIKGEPEVSGKIETDISHKSIFLKEGKYGVMVKYGKMTEETYNTLMAKTDVVDRLYVYDGTTFTLATGYVSDKEYYTLEDYVELPNKYFPVQYQLKGNTKYNENYTADLTVDTLAGLVADLNTKIKDKTFDPNDNLANVFKLDDGQIVWQWAYEHGTEDDGNNACVYCKADTILGHLMATGVNVVKHDTSGYIALTEDDDYYLNTVLNIDITITQTN